MTTRSPNDMTLPEVVIHFGPKERNYPCSAAMNPLTGELTFHFNGYGEPEDLTRIIPVTDLETMIEIMKVQVAATPIPTHLH